MVSGCFICYDEESVNYLVSGTCLGLECNLLPRALFPGFGGGPPRPGDEVA